MALAVSLFVLGCVSLSGSNLDKAELVADTVQRVLREIRLMEERSPGGDLESEDVAKVVTRVVLEEVEERIEENNAAWWFKLIAAVLGQGLGLGVLHEVRKPLRAAKMGVVGGNGL